MISKVSLAMFRARCWTNVLLILLCFFFSFQSFAQFSEPVLKGMPFIRNYAPVTYGAHNQNWAIAQDLRGVMYFGNGSGILEYDGVSWNIIRNNKGTVVRSLAADEKGNIYVGAYGDIGYLAPDSTQQLHFVSLVPKLDEQYRVFSDVWQTLSASDGIYFVTQKYVFRWDGENMRVWNANTSFHLGFAVQGQFFVKQINVGLMHIKSDSLVMIPSGEQFATVDVMTMLPSPSGVKGQYLMGTHTNGLLHFDGQNIESFPTDADGLLKTSLIYRGTQLPNGHYALGTMRDGVFIIDKKGTLQLHLNKAAGLQDEMTFYLYPDHQGSLWIAMHLGISRAETGSPHTYFGEREGLEGSVNKILRHQAKLYAATTMGVYVLDTSPESIVASGKFQRIQNISPQVWAMQPFGNSILTGSYDRVYEIRDGHAKSISGGYCLSLLRSQIDTNRVFVGLQEGVKSLYYSKGVWRDEGVFEETSKVVHMHELPDGRLWLTARHKGLQLVDFSNGFTLKPTITLYDTLQGLTSLEKTTPIKTAQGIRFASAQGLFSFDEQQQRFYRDTSLIKGLPDPETYLFSVEEDRRGNLWLVTPGTSGVAELQSDKTYQWESGPFFRIAGIDDYCAYSDPLSKDVTWLGCIDRVIRFDGAMQQDTGQHFRTLIRQVVINEDSLLFGGAGMILSDVFTLNHGFKSLRIRYAAPSFDDEANTLYQYRLGDADDEWSNWSKETYKDYTGISHGSYRFQVRSKNIHQQIGETAVFEFEILPPFYLTWWAYVLYGLLLIGLLLLVRRREVYRMRKKHAAELRQLELEKFKELDQLKSHFFANISHEFRTPLTLILGPTDELLASQPNADQTKKYHIIQRNAQRLLTLINQILDLSKLDAGKMKLVLHTENIIQLLKNLVFSFESLVQNKNISLEFKSDVDHASMQCDRDKIEQVLTNLISNAIKFTPPGGHIIIEVRTKNKNGHIQIDVTNTGPGIPEEQLPHIFDRFYQGSEASVTGEPGTGIGLALAKELVELHKGRISVSSIANKTTTFSILFPLEEVATSKQQLTIELGRQSLPEETASLASTLNIENTLLLVEDNPDMRLFLNDILRREYKIIEAVDGMDGVDKAFEHIPDLIVSDVMMPRLDGMDLCHLLKQDPRTSHIPIVLLTAKADIESRLAGLKRGADDYLAKPFNRDELLIRTHNLLELRKRLWQRYASLQEPPAVEDTSIKIEDAFLQKVRAILEERLSDSEFEIDSLAQHIGMSRSQLFRKIKALTGQSPSIYIRSIRLHKGKELLETTQMNVNEVAYTVGFSTPAYFSDAFNEAYGVRPSQVRK